LHVKHRVPADRKNGGKTLFAEEAPFFTIVPRGRFFFAKDVKKTSKKEEKRLQSFLK